MEKDLWRIRIITTLTNFGVIGIFVGVGYLFDLYFGTKPKLLLLGLIISFPISQILTFKLLFRKNKVQQ